MRCSGFASAAGAASGSAVGRARPWPAHLTATLDLELLDGDRPSAAAPSADGRCRWSLDAGSGGIEAGGSGAVRLDERGLAVLYAGAGSASMLRQAGLLIGGTERTDLLLDAVSAGPAPALLDFF